VKFGRIFIEKIKHPVDEPHYDAFRPLKELPQPRFEIPFNVRARFRGNQDALMEYDKRVCCTCTNSANAVSDPLRALTYSQEVGATVGAEKLFKRRLILPGVPQIGISWFIQEPGLSPTLLADGVALMDGEPYGDYINDYINYPREHSCWWPDVKQHLSPSSTIANGEIGRGAASSTTRKRRALRFASTSNYRNPGLKRRFSYSSASWKPILTFMSDPHYTDARFTLDLRGSAEGPV
jgi:hypothetical protein